MSPFASSWALLGRAAEVRRGPAPPKVSSPTADLSTDDACICKRLQDGQVGRGNTAVHIRDHAPCARAAVGSPAFDLLPAGEPFLRSGLVSLQLVGARPRSPPAGVCCDQRRRRRRSPFHRSLSRWWKKTSMGHVVARTSSGNARLRSTSDRAAVMSAMNLTRIASLTLP